jgi:hypothetical protein
MNGDYVYKVFQHINTALSSVEIVYWSDDESVRTDRSENRYFCPSHCIVQ